jgi:hypothetical protein
MAVPGAGCGGPRDARRCPSGSPSTRSRRANHSSPPRRRFSSQREVPVTRSSFGRPVDEVTCAPARASTPGSVTPARDRRPDGLRPRGRSVQPRAKATPVGGRRAIIGVTVPGYRLGQDLMARTLLKTEAPRSVVGLPRVSEGGHATSAHGRCWPGRAVGDRYTRTRPTCRRCAQRGGLVATCNRRTPKRCRARVARRAMSPRALAAGRQRSGGSPRPGPTAALRRGRPLSH